MADILVVKPRTLNAADKSALRKAGVVVVETANPDEIKFLRATVELPPHHLALAAMKALAKSSNIHNEHLLFVKLVTEAMERRDEPTKDRP